MRIINLTRRGLFKHPSHPFTQKVNKDHQSYLTGSNEYFDRGLKPASKPLPQCTAIVAVGSCVDGSGLARTFGDDHDLQESEAELGRLFVGQAPAVPPTWTPFIGQFAAGALPRLVNQSCAAVLFLEIVADGSPPIKRTMALTFGTGHHALDPDAFERGFGLRVVLNSVTRSNLRSLDIATLDATTFLRRIQASRDADLQGFGIDIDRDLLRLAAGSPRDLTFARTLERDAFRSIRFGIPKSGGF